VSRGEASQQVEDVGGPREGYNEAAMKCGKCGDLLEPECYGMTWRCYGCQRVVYFKGGFEMEFPEGCLMVWWEDPVP